MYFPSFPSVGDYKLYQCVGIGCILCPGQVQVTTRAPVVITQAPVGPTCTGKPNGLNPYPGRELTGHYILCDNGVVIETGICILNKILDPASHTCIDPANPGLLLNSLPHKPVSFLAIPIQQQIEIRCQKH